MCQNKKSKLKAKKSEAPFGLAASVDYSFIQGLDFDKQPINVDAYFDEEQFCYCGSDKEGFTLKFRRCDLLLILDGGDIALPPALYRRTLPPEEFKSLLTKTIQAHVTTGGKAALGLTKPFSAILASVGLEVSGNASIEASKSGDENLETERQIQYQIVNPISHNRWKIGDEYLGDPNRIDGALHGAYFREPPDDRDEAKWSEDCLTALGMLVIHPNRKTANIQIELRARFQDCIFIPFGPGIQSKNSAAENEKAKIEKVLALKKIQRTQKSRGFSMRKNEFIVARCSVRLERQ